MTLFSRRGLIGQGAAALALTPAMARAATGTRLPAPDSQLPPPESIQGDRDAQDHLTIDTYINDKGPFSFVVDTGADRSVISDSVVAALGLVQGGDVIVQGIARALPAQSVKLANLRVGRISCDNLETPILPKSLLGSDGYLGLDVIDRQSVTFDFQNRRLTVDPSAPPRTDWKYSAAGQHNSEGLLVRADGSQGRLTAVDSFVDGTRAYAFVDSGAEISIGNTHLFDRLQRNEGAQYLSEQSVHLIGVTGGAVIGRIMAVKDVQLANVHFSNSILVISDLPVFDIWGLADRPALFVGMNFLRQTSSFTVDYGRKEYRFKLAQTLIARRT